MKFENIQTVGCAEIVFFSIGEALPNNSIASKIIEFLRKAGLNVHIVRQNQVKKIVGNKKNTNFAVVDMLKWVEDKIETRSYLNSSTPADVRKQLVSVARVIQNFVNPSISGENLSKKSQSADNQSQKNAVTDKKYADAYKNGDQPLFSSNGHILGFVHNGEIYIVEKYLNSNTPVHEYTHIWNKLLQ